MIVGGRRGGKEGLRGLGLDLAHENVLGVCELVLVEGVMLDSGSDAGILLVMCTS